MSKENQWVKKNPTVKLWSINNDDLTEVERPKLNYEDRLEDWIAKDISILDPNLLVIGRQVTTEYGGEIDLLCIDEKGDLTVIELKRDKTPREVTAQAMDYASWVVSLNPDQVQEIAETYLEIPFEESFQARFSSELPESINEEHRMLVVGSEIDSSSRRIINYLSETYGVPINAATFNYFKQSDQEFIARTFLIETSTQSVPKRIRSKRRKNLSHEQLQAIATQNGVGSVYEYLLNELALHFDRPRRTRSSLGFVGQYKETKRATILSLVPVESSEEKGLKWQIYDLRFRTHFNLDEQTARSIYPLNRTKWVYGGLKDQQVYEERGELADWSGYEGYMNYDEADAFLTRLRDTMR